jgi:uncharacterized membrane protein
MMSQNRQEEKIEKDPKDYMINLKSELGRMLMKSVHLIMHQQEE